MRIEKEIKQVEKIKESKEQKTKTLIIQENVFIKQKDNDIILEKGDKIQIIIGE